MALIVCNKLYIIVRVCYSNSRRVCSECMYVIVIVKECVIECMYVIVIVGEYQSV